MSELPIAITTGPHTRPLADAVGRLLVEKGRRIRSYEADGLGGRELEQDILAGRIAAVLDLTLTELAAELAGSAGGAGPDRLTAAAMRGVPQVIVPGGLEETTPEECDRLGREIANKAIAARGPTTISDPLSAASRRYSLKASATGSFLHVPVRELELHVNDPAFAAVLAELLEVE